MSLDLIAVLVGIAVGLSALLGGWWRWVRPRYRKAKRTVAAVTETLVGRDAITDPSTGRELVPAQPGLGVRMATMEEAIVRLSHMDGRVTAVETTVGEHTRQIAELRDARIERLVTQAESAQAWRAMADGELTDDDEEQP